MKKPPVVGPTEALLRLWSTLEYSANSDLTDAVVHAIETDAHFDVNRPMGDDRLPLQAALALPPRRRMAFPLGPIAQWPLPGEPAWNEEGHHDRQERVAAALLARGADPFRTGPSSRDSRTALQSAVSIGAQSIVAAIMRCASVEGVDFPRLLTESLHANQTESVRALLSRTTLDEHSPLIFAAARPETLRLMLEAGVSPAVRSEAGLTLTQYWSKNMKSASDRSGMEAVLGEYTVSHGSAAEHAADRLRNSAYHDRLGETTALLSQGVPTGDAWVYAVAGVMGYAFAGFRAKATVGVASLLAQRSPSEMDADERAVWPLVAAVLHDISWKGGANPDVTDASRQKWREFAVKTGVSPADLKAPSRPEPPSGWTSVLSGMDKAMEQPLDQRLAGMNRLSLWRFVARAGLRPGDYFDALGASPGRWCSIASDLEKGQSRSLLTGMRAASLVPHTWGGVMALLYTAQANEAVLEALETAAPLIQATLAEKPSAQSDWAAVRDFLSDADASRMEVLVRFIDAQRMAADLPSPLTPRARHRL